MCSKYASSLYCSAKTPYFLVEKAEGKANSFGLNRLKGLCWVLEWSYSFSYYSNVFD